MTVHYKLWLSIEEIDEDQFHYEDIDLPTSLASFRSQDSAIAFADHLHAIVDSAREETRHEIVTGV